MFEDAGLVDPRSAYHVDLERVVNTKNQDVKTIVDRGRYFSIFAPRQSGKTTFLEGFCLELEKDSTYVPIILSFQRYKSLDKQTFYQQIQKELYTQLTNRLTSVDCPSLEAAVSYLDSH